MAATAAAPQEAIAKTSRVKPRTMARTAEIRTMAITPRSRYDGVDGLMRRFRLPYSEAIARRHPTVIIAAPSGSTPLRTCNQGNEIGDFGACYESHILRLRGLSRLLRRGRNDGPRETELGCFLPPRHRMRDWRNRARKPALAEEHAMRRQASPAEGRDEGGRGRKIRSGLADSQAARDVEIDVMLAEPQ